MRISMLLYRHGPSQKNKKKNDDDDQKWRFLVAPEEL